MVHRNAKLGLFNFNVSASGNLKQQNFANSIQIYNFRKYCYEIQGYLLRDTITGKFTIPDRDGQKAAFDEDKAKEAKIASVFDVIQFQTDYVNELSEITKG